jgi:hypothetical protein
MATGLHYQWPEGDTTPWRLIQKPAGERWGAFRILGSSTLPVGDFDSKRRPYIPEAHRAYKTNKGWRIMYVGHYAPPMDWMLDRMEEQGADPDFTRIAKKRRYYAARVDPKYEIPYLGFEDWAITTLVDAIGEPHPFWEEYISVHDELTRANIGASVLV